MESLLDHAIEALAVATTGLLAFLVRSFFNRIHDDLIALRSSLDKLSGRFDTIQEDARELATKVALTQQETRAQWRHIDGSYRRASDLNGGDD